MLKGPSALEVRYRQQVVPALTREFGFKNPMQVPRVRRVSVNIGLGEALKNQGAVDAALGDVTAITGQKPVVTKARKSIANFALREGQAVGVSVTLRGSRMYQFLDRLMNIALPRVRDFRGVPRNSFDGRGNYSLGLKEQVVFPEIDYNKIDRIRGLQINVQTTAGNDEEGRRLLELLGMPFVKPEVKQASRN
jgi:large subunit ribosomal protein L5